METSPQASVHLAGTRRVVATLLAVAAVVLGACAALVMFGLVTEYEAITESHGFWRDLLPYVFGIPLVPAVAAAVVSPRAWSGCRRPVLLATFVGALAVGLLLAERLALATR
jgi:hypothetical protein